MKIEVRNKFFVCLAMMLSICQASRQTHIVHMDKGAMPSNFNGDHIQWYHASLKSVSDTANILYTYGEVAYGFSARLSAKEAELVAQKPGVVHVHPEGKYELHTTRTPEFLGLTKNNNDQIPLLENAGDLIIGLMDSGIWPESPSFNDKGLGPVPMRWKGECEVSKDFKPGSCNRKIVGAMTFSKGYEAENGPFNKSVDSSPRDTMGHGSLTASTAAGSPVARASLWGFANGTARGMSPRARVAVYKVVWEGRVYGSDFLAAADKALEDGVDIISASLGGPPSDYSGNSFAIAAFKAMEKGVLVSCAVGNSGPTSRTLYNDAPWITTAGASTLDRDFLAKVILGNGKAFLGESLYNGKPLPDSVPLVYAGNVSTSNGSRCINGSLVPRLVKHKIVVCDRGENDMVEKGFVVKFAGGVGMIVANTLRYGEGLLPKPHLLPTLHVGQKIGDLIKSYIFSTTCPEARMTHAYTMLNVKPSPVVADFSSRGPSKVAPALLKPDLVAPGVGILAAWSPASSLTWLDFDTRHADYNIVYGTSLSCPHISGLMALLKAAHPEWSPAAIRSALMTTADADYSASWGSSPLLDSAAGKPASPFAYGVGHVHPLRAFNPGLIYNASVDDYINFLCALKYNSAQMKRVTGKNTKCGRNKDYRVEDLNYPSISVPLRTGEFRRVKYSRRVTNVAEKPATYKASVFSPQGVKVGVEPSVLRFTHPNEEKAFSVTVSASSASPGTVQSARLEWKDETHTVGTNIGLFWA